ncbi:MAG TPA: YtzH-like family protein [Bacillales bacterium]|nr:YtzH-like family protein [Bacillales bacterium]
MTLGPHHRLAVLSDILRSHQLDCCGTASEYEQAGRIAQTLINDTDIPEEMREALTGIEQYTAQGAKHERPEQYILENQTYLNEWIHTLDRFSSPK